MVVIPVSRARHWRGWGPGRRSPAAPPRGRPRHEDRGRPSHTGGFPRGVPGRFERPTGCVTRRSRSADRPRLHASRAEHRPRRPRGTSPHPPGERDAPPPDAGAEPLGVLPLPVTRPVLNPAVNDADLDRTVCSGTDKYRPPVSYTNKVKHIELSTPVGSYGQITDPRDGRVYQVPGYEGYAGLGPADADRVELDHFLPLSDGGDGYDPTNLWPEIGGTANAPLAGADGQPADSHAKDGLE